MANVGIVQGRPLLNHELLHASECSDIGICFDGDVPLAPKSLGN